MMIDLFVVIIVCLFLSNQIEIKCGRYSNIQEGIKKSKTVWILYVILVLILVVFSGVRTTYNDTETYMESYKFLNTGEINLFTLFKPYGGFIIFETLLKKFISENPQTLILISSLVVNVIFLYFYAKYSKYFMLTVFSYLILGTYIFSMAGIKQIMAMSISLFAIEALLNKNYGKFLIWLLIAMTFHPYIICLVIIPLFKEGVWNRKIIITIVGVILVVANLEILLNLAGMIGKDYTIEEMTNYTVNPMRVMIEMIPVVFSAWCRKRINKQNNEMLNMSINMMVINALMISLGLFLNPIYFARIGTYFSVLNAIAIPTMLNVMYQGNEHRRVNILIYYSFYFVYFVLDLTKLGTFSITYDLFNHIKIF